MDGGSGQRHQCLIYQGSPAAQLNSLAEIIVRKLREGYRCLYLHSPSLVSAMRYCLQDMGLNVTENVEKGALILSSDQSHLENGKFDPRKMMALLETTLQKALDDGYKGLWASGDMTWELGSESFDKLIEYEYMLDEFMQQHSGLSGICQYHYDTMPLHALLTGFHTHKEIGINQAIMRANPHYWPPNLKEPPASSDMELQDLIDELDK